ncbi:hypothetical protein NEMIN01_0151 [Nematocida minor]|uniref:uncharacterized protein n=1 Tax=Nematocida minor TaxID=1912983 RepID=UPI00221ECFD1|nr:uncharacterized protein NEMIN01_0047 [Nematocida minor]XP_051332053.1 uncharacterized protein NEMIN01_0151 [Nematocida minor]KAI5188783.1 hypothetical protein NEMIN01_0047 [Nematocida minor]KAI5188887.1 hypothetical protein NEMIN01_0151 [Nematocida minor]
MKKKYTGMVFTKDPAMSARTQEEREVMAHLDRKVHNNDLEDDFFTLGEGLREEMSEDSDASSVLELSEEESYSTHHEEENMDVSNVQVEGVQSVEQKETLGKDCFASLIEQINAQSGRGFAMLTSFSERKKRPTKKQKRVNTSIEACNSILNRMGSYIPPMDDETVVQVSKKQKIDEKCENWEDSVGASKRNQPNII